MKKIPMASDMKETTRDWIVNYIINCIEEMSEKRYFATSFTINSGAGTEMIDEIIKEFKKNGFEIIERTDDFLISW